MSSSRRPPLLVNKIKEEKRRRGEERKVTRVSTRVSCYRYEGDTVRTWFVVDGCEGGYLRCEVLEQRGVQLEGVVSDLKGQGQGRDGVEG